MGTEHALHEVRISASVDLQADGPVDRSTVANGTRLVVASMGSMLVRSHPSAAGLFSISYYTQVFPPTIGTGSAKVVDIAGTARIKGLARTAALRARS